MPHQMTSALTAEIERIFPGKALLTIADLCLFLGCSEKVVYNWMKRAEPTRRPPRIKVGQEVKFPRAAFVHWLTQEQK